MEAHTVMMFLYGHKCNATHRASSLIPISANPSFSYSLYSGQLGATTTKNHVKKCLTAGQRPSGHIIQGNRIKRIKSGAHKVRHGHIFLLTVFEWVPHCLFSLLLFVNIILVLVIIVVGTNTPQCIVKSIKSTKLLPAMNYALIVRAF